MAINKKMMVLNVLGSLLMSQTLNAEEISRAPAAGKPSYKIQGVYGRAEADGLTQTSTQEGTVKFTSSEVVVHDTSVANLNSECRLDQGESSYIPLDLIEQVSRSGKSIDIKISSDNNKVIVDMPPILDGCGRFVPELKQNTKTLNVMVLMKIKTRDGKDVKYSDFLSCLEEKKYVKDSKVNHGEIDGSHYVSNSYSLGFDFNKNKDITKSVMISYGYPFAFSDEQAGYKPKHGLVSTQPVPGMSCMLEEKIAAKPVYINKGKDAYLAEIIEICKSGDANKIAAMLRSLGNVQALSSVMEEVKTDLTMGYLEAAKFDAEAIYKELEKIESRITNDRDKMDEKQAKKEAALYSAKLKELNKVYLDPAITVLEELMVDRDRILEKLDGEDTSPEIEKIDKKIAELNEGIAKFSKRDPTALANLYALMEKHALNDSAKTVEDVRLKSYFYGKVYAGREDQSRGKPITMERANKEQVDRLKGFEKSLKSWTDVYQVSKGNLAPIQRVERERAQSIQRMNSRYATFEQGLMKDYQSSCKVGMLGTLQNQNKCKQFYSSYQTKMNQELKRRERDLKGISAHGLMLDKMGISYNQYQLTMAQREANQANGFESFGSSPYTSYEDNFNDLYPQYNGPQMSTAYDASMYSMGGGIGANFGGMNGMAMNGGMGLQQPSMMQAPQQGGWAAF